MGRHGAPRDSQNGRGAHRAKPTGQGTFGSLGHMLGSTVPKRVQPPRFLRVLTISGLLVGLMMFGYSTTQVYLRFTEPPVEQESFQQEGDQLPGGSDGEATDSERTGSLSPGNGIAVAYSLSEGEGDEFIGQLVVTNASDEPLNDWEIELTLTDAFVLDASDTDWAATDDGALFTRPADEDGIAPGQSKTITFAVAGPPQTPGCTLNGAPCGLE